jgi:preprotein translocase subunit SecF
VDQAKARFDGWKQKKTRTDTEKAREKHFEEQAKQEDTVGEARKKESFGQTVTRILVGLLALAILIYIIVRHPNLPPWMAQQMVNQLLEEWNL